MRKIDLRHPSAAVALAAALTAALVGAPPASATASPSGAHQILETIQLVARQTGSESLHLGKGEKGPSLGDELIISEDLYRNGTKIGDHSVVCTYVHVGPDELQCLGTFALPQGQITGQALLHLPAAPAVDIAITGGTGTFSKARGFVHTVPAGTTERKLTFNIIR